MISFRVGVNDSQSIIAGGDDLQFLAVHITTGESYEQRGKSDGNCDATISVRGIKSTQGVAMSNIAWIPAQGLKAGDRVVIEIVNDEASEFSPSESFEPAPDAAAHDYQLIGKNIYKRAKEE